MAVEITSGVYCPLTPRDPIHRLHALIQQTNSRLTLVHWLTKFKFNDDLVSFDIDSLLINNVMMADVVIDRFSNVVATPDDIAYIIFTSGSTGIPKAVCLLSLLINLILYLYFVVGSNKTSKFVKFHVFSMPH
jgi:non-ribosomal peptide synthetase component F